MWQTWQLLTGVLSSRHLHNLQNLTWMSFVTEVNNTVILALPSDEDMVIAYVSEGLGPIKVAAQVGDKRFFHSTAGGRCLLAHSSQNLINKVLQSELPRMTPATIVDPDMLRKELAKIRQRGFAFDREGNFHGISAFAVPILNRDGLSIAAITSAGPSSTVSWQNRIFFIEKLQHCAPFLSVLERP
jgi:IclR family acetate operon transcriptional repressor